MTGVLFGAVASPIRLQPMTPAHADSISATSQDRKSGRELAAVDESGLSLLPFGVSTAERLFDAKVDLKVAIAAYAMHLTQSQRDRAFSEIDFLLNEDGWYDEDELPQKSSFIAFLKWAIYARDFSWTSLGIGDDGHTLVAWVTDVMQVTASFSEKAVRWTARSRSSDEAAAGLSTLRNFKNLHEFYLGSKYEA